MNGYAEILEARRLLTTAGNFVAGELLVGFKAGVNAAEIAQFYTQHGVHEQKALDANVRDSGRRLKLVAVPPAQTLSLATTLARDPRVAYAEPNYLIPSAAAATPNDPDLARDWGLVNTGQTGGTPDADIDADEAWESATGGTDVVVAVVDTGVDYTHPDLAANMWHNPGEVAGNGLDDDGNGVVDDYYGYDFVNGDSDPIDDVGHGSHVAGTLGMVGNNGVGATGVNWHTQIMALKTDAGSGNPISDLILAYDYVTMMRGRGVNVRVINNSNGAALPLMQSWKDAIDRAGQAGILFAAAAGNDANDNDATPFYPASFDSPHVISVAATDSDDRIADFSCWGATSVDLAAPGVDVWSTYPNNSYGYSSGTSMATPHVAGAAALVWSAHPELSVAEVKARLLAGADPIGDIGANASRPTVTSGRLNVRNALLVPPSDNETVAPAAVGSLSGAAASPWSVALTWTATGDDGTAGRAAYYDVRYSTSPITAANWSSASRASGEPAPRAAGSADGSAVSGLEPGTLYYFAMKVKDNAGNESGLSNVAQLATPAARVLLNDDVEGSVTGWSATGLWHRSNVRGHDSATAWYYGRDDTRSYFNGTQDSGTLTLAAPIDLTGVGQALLRFSEWRRVIDSNPLDTARVQVSRNGVDWSTASETFASTHDWERATVDLTPFIGGPVYVRFEFNKNAYNFLPFAISHGYEGWHVDDVQVLVPAATQPAGLSVNDVTVSEGNDGTTRAVFTVTRSSGNGKATVRYATTDGSATAAAGDYQPASGTLSFASGETRKVVTVLVNGDRTGESDEGFSLNLSNPTGAALVDGRGNATVVDDEPRIYFNGNVAFAEGDDRMTLHMTVNLSVPSSQPVTVSYATADETATAGDDYLAAAGTLTFSPGQTQRKVDIQLPKDNKSEPIVEAFFVNLSNASANAVILSRGVAHIIDDDVAHGNGNALAASVSPTFSAVGITSAGANSASALLDEADDIDDADVA
jgi:subtilisin family serine protease